MSKKTYKKPTLASRQVELGVFGTYGNGGPDGKDGGGNSAPHPFRRLTDRNITMD